MYQRIIQKTSPEAGNLVGVGIRNTWDFRVLGRAPLLTVPVFVGNWWLVPVEQDSSLIPTRACERVQAIYRAGFRPKGFVIAHETTNLLSAPPKPSTQVSPLGPPIALKQLLSRPVLLTAGAILFLLVFGPLLVQLLVALVVGVLSLLLIPIVLMGMVGAILVDPALIAVTEDGYWVEIDHWWS